MATYSHSKLIIREEDESEESEENNVQTTDEEEEVSEPTESPEADESESEESGSEEGGNTGSSGEDGTIVEPLSVLNQPFSGSTNVLPGGDSVNYLFDFDMMTIGSIDFDPDSDQDVADPFQRVCYGLAMRAKGDSQYIHEVNGSVNDLDRDVLNQGNTADPELEGARVAVAFDEESIHLLTEVGGGIPREKKIKQYVNYLLNGDDEDDEGDDEEEEVDTDESEGSEGATEVEEEESSDEESEEVAEEESDNTDDTVYTVELVRKEGKPDKELVKALLGSRLSYFVISLKRYPLDRDEGEETRNGRPSMKSDFRDAIPAQYRSTLKVNDNNAGDHDKSVKEVLIDSLGLVGEVNIPQNSGGEDDSTPTLDEWAEGMLHREFSNQFYKVEVAGIPDDGEVIQINFTDPQRKDRIGHIGDEYMSPELGEVMIRAIYDEVSSE